MYGSDDEREVEISDDDFVILLDDLGDDPHLVDERPPHYE